MRLGIFSFSCIVALFFSLAVPAQAQELLLPEVQTVRAEVVAIHSEREEELPGLDVTAVIQDVQVLIRDGERAGDTVSFENDRFPLEIGEDIFLNRQISLNGDEVFMVKDVDRRFDLWFLGGFFVLVLILFAGRQGVRALLSLAVSIGGIVFLLVPALLAGYNPALTSLVVSALVLAVVLFGTHGFKPHTYVAYGGTMSAVIVTCLIAWYNVSAMRLSGFGDDASVYLNFATNGQLDFAGLLLGSIIIGILGVLDDVSITQASVVQELKSANAKLSIRELYQRAIRVGRDHVGSLVNTLALAYVGASLPLVLFFAGSDAPIGQLLNQEIVAAELVRIIVGSIGLILAVPFTTILAAWWFGTHEVEEGFESCHGHHHH